MGFVQVICIAVCLHMAHGALVNSDVTRTVDLKTHIVKISSSVTMRNDGPSSVSKFEIQVEPEHLDNLAYVEVTLVTEGESETLKATKKPKGVFEYTLPKAVPAEETFEVKVDQSFTRMLKPYPAEITQSQKQLVTYDGNHVFYSPYVTETQTTKVELFSNVIENHSKFGTTEVEGSTITYGGSDEYKNVQPLTVQAMSLHFENNSPFLVATRMNRVIEVSHWGNIAVEEEVFLLQTGAKFKGSFSRYDYQRLPNSGVPSVKSFKTILPASAADVYYRDEIGNISTSNLQEHDDSVELEIRPRFPLFGGWKTRYYIGYNLPSYAYLYKTGDLHALRMRFVDHVYDDMVIDELSLKIILPESSKQISVALPYRADRLDDALHFTYLDTVGRPVITFEKKNLVEQHIQDFTLSYNFNRMMLLQEPLLVVGSFFLLFFTVIIIVRLDFSITHDKISEARMRVQGVLAQVQAQQARRATCYTSYDNAIKAYKANKDNNEYVNAKKGVDKTHRESTNAINALLPKIREDSAEAYEKIAQMTKMDQQLMEKYGHSGALAEKLVSKKINKDIYMAHEGKNRGMIEELQEKIDDLAEGL